jgi:site-specific recombinase XerD
MTMRTAVYLSKYVRMFFEDHLACRRNLTGSTIRSYRDAVKLFIAFVVQQAKKPATDLLVVDMTESTIVQFLNHLENKRGNSIQTRNHRLVVLRSLLQYIALQEPLMAEHCRRLLDIPTKKNRYIPEIGYLEKTEIAAILEATDRRCSIGRRDHAILLFMYNTGARVQEAADARVSWLSFEQPCKVEILGKGRKWRTCPLWDDVAGVLRELLEEGGALVDPDRYLFVNRFGKQLSRFGIRNIIDKYKNKAALRIASLRDKKVTPHTIRHTTAMHLLQSGVDINVIRSWLGHVNLATTHRYVEIDLAMKTKALAACELPDNQGSRHRWRPKQDILAWLESL